MKSLRNIIILLLTINFAYGQIHIDQKLINKIEEGATTRWDIEQRFGKGEYVDKKIVSPENELDIGSIHSNGLTYASSGLTFVCAYDGEVISEIQYRKPYEGTFSLSNKIIIGNTTLGQAFPNIDTFKVTTTLSNNYWYFTSDIFTFYIEKSAEHKKINSYDDLHPFKDYLSYYKNQPICIVKADLYPFSPDFAQAEPLESNGKYFIRPVNAPKSETHLNCYEYGWNLPKILVPFFAMLGGHKDAMVKQGYWKEYSTHKKIIYEGEYKDGDKIGVFKYYDNNGVLERTENNYRVPWKWIFISTFILLILLVIWKREKTKRTDNISSCCTTPRKSKS